jgi:hypothetical protein
VACALALSLGDGAVPTLLIDADSEGGGLAAQLDIGPAGHMQVEIAPNVRFMELSARDMEMIDRRDLIATARESNHAVVIDLGHHAGALQRHLAAASEWLLWVVTPDRCGLERADQAIGSGALTAAGGGLVLNRIRRGCLADAGEVLSTRHALPVLACIKERGKVRDRIASGRPVHRLRCLRRTVGELARCVHPDARPARPAWP